MKNVVSSQQSTPHTRDANVGVCYAHIWTAGILCTPTAVFVHKLWMSTLWKSRSFAQCAIFFYLVEKCKKSIYCKMDDYGSVLYTHTHTHTHHTRLCSSYEICIYLVNPNGVTCRRLCTCVRLACICTHVYFVSLCRSGGGGAHNLFDDIVVYCCV